MDIDYKKFEQAKNNCGKLYKKIVKVRCPYFKENIAFNAKGLEHLRFKGIRKARSLRDQYVRFRLIDLAPKIIKASNTLQGISFRKGLERKKINSRWEKRL